MHHKKVLSRERKELDEYVTKGFHEYLHDQQIKPIGHISKYQDVKQFFSSMPSFPRGNKFLFIHVGVQVHVKQIVTCISCWRTERELIILWQGLCTDQQHIFIQAVVCQRNIGYECMFLDWLLGSIDDEFIHRFLLCNQKHSCQY